MSIVVESVAKDIHAHAVQWALQTIGQQCFILQTDKFPSEMSLNYHLTKTGNISKLTDGNIEVDYSSIKTIWHRRRSEPKLNPKLHPDDVSHTTLECRDFISSFRDLSNSDVFEANNISAAFKANQKLIQLEHAIRLGFNVPETVSGNDPEAIREFYLKQNRRLLFKSFTPHTWVESAKNLEYSSYSSLLSDNTFQDASGIRNCPSIYQEYVEKAFEIRVLVMGHECAAVKIISQEHSKSRVDWRADQSSLKYELFELPEEIYQLIIKFMASLDLVTGSFDFIVTPDGQYYFIEVNESGQFLFLELYVPKLPILDMFSQFLITGRNDYKYSPTKKSVSFQDYLSTDSYKDFYQDIMSKPEPK